MKQLSAAADKSVCAKPSTGRLLRLSYFFNALFPNAGDKLVLQALADVKPGIAACSAHTALPCSCRFCLSERTNKKANPSVRIFIGFSG